MRKIAFYIIFALLPAMLPGQDVFDPEKTYYDAEFLEKEKNYSDALTLYQSLIEKGYENANINYKIGISWLHIPGRKPNSIPFLEKATKSTTFKYNNEQSYREHKAPVEAFFYLGQAYQVNNQLDPALKTYHVYKKKLISKKRSTTEVDRMIKSCQTAQEFSAQPADADVSPFYFTHSSLIPERAAFSVDGETMVFMNRRKYYNAIFYTKKIPGQWLPPVNITMELESDGKFEINSLSPDGSALILSYFNGTDYDLYISNLENGRWSKCSAFPKSINSMKDETAGFLAPGKKVLYFASNRRGGLGGLDIYQATIQPDGSWGLPQNLGNVINTSYDETDPCMLKNGNFYFSSSGHETMGGYDVFVSRQQQPDKWTEPENPGVPLNTTDDDLYFQATGEGFSGYIPKFYDQTGSPPILSYYTLYDAQHPRKVTLRVSVLFPPGVVFQPTTLQIVDQQTGALLLRDTLYTSRDQFSHQLPPGDYTIQALGNGMEPFEKNFNLTRLKKILEMDVKMVTAIGEKAQSTYTFSTIYFNFDRHNLTRDSRLKLDSVILALKDLTLTQISVSGFTDDIGKAEYNMQLSLNRAKAVSQYLVKNGISRERIKVIGKGESEPVALNHKKSGRDNPEGRRYNRRVVFSVTGKGAELIHINPPQIPDTYRIR